MREKIAPEVFKLSYKPNPKLPFLADCLRLEVDELGYHVKTTRNLKFGDVVAIDKPFCKALNAENYHVSCCNCLNDNFFDLEPCDGCTMAMFCSENCRNEATRKFHKYECQIGFKLFLLNPKIVIQLSMRVFFEALDAHDGNMQSLMSAIENNSSHKTIFDFDLSKDDEKEVKKKMFLASNSMATTKKHLLKLRMPDKYQVAAMILTLYNTTQFKIDFKSKKYQNFIRRFISKNLENISYKSLVHIFPDLGFTGDGSFPSLTLITPSCAPNVQVTIVNAKCYVVVLRSIKAGEELSIGYGVNHFEHNLSIRKQYLRQRFNFDCKCIACVNDYKCWMHLSLLKVQNRTDPALQMMLGDIQTKLKVYKDFYKQNHALDLKYPSFEHYQCHLMIGMQKIFGTNRYIANLSKKFI
jgi:hypothetical protein